MTRMLTHRGPDQEGYLWTGRAGLGSRRLSIIDLSEAGRMPLYGRTKALAVVQNGEIYNFRALRSGLAERGHEFRGGSDTEVIVRMYEEHGPACFAMLDGMFAIAVLDQQRRKLVLARDRFGEKPLYYHLDRDGNLVFASELKAILRSPLCAAEIEWDSLYEFLSLGYILAPATAFRQTFKLLPGHFLTFDLDTGKLETTRYWSPPRPTFAPIVRSEAEYEHELRDLFFESVRTRLVSDVPVGAFLSGGIDSSLVVAAMTRLGAAPVRTFSIGYSLNGAKNENPAAATVAKRLGLDHTAISVDVRDFSRVLEKLPWMWDEPVADPAALAVYLIAERARAAGTTVMLSGDGGDELFMGYQLHRFARYLWQAYRLPRSVRSLAGSATMLASRALNNSRLDKGAKLLEFDSFPEAMYYLLGYGAWSLPELGKLWLRPRPANTGARFLAGLEGCTSSDDAVASATSTVIQTYLADNNLQRMDRAAMANGVETRTPFLDPRMIDFAMKLPAELRIRGRTGKLLLRELLGSLLGEDIAARPKQGFDAFPMATWLRGDLAYLIDEYLSPEFLRAQGLFAVAPIEQMIAQHRQGGRYNHWWRIWLLIVLQMWLREWGTL